MKNLIRCLFGIPVVLSVPQPPEPPYALLPKPQRVPVDLILEDLALTPLPTALMRPAPLLGEELDDHGCLISAGYKWCPSTDECLRPWMAHCQEFDFPYNALYEGSGIIIPQDPAPIYLPQIKSSESAI